MHTEKDNLLDFGFVKRPEQTGIIKNTVEQLESFDI